MPRKKHEWYEGAKLHVIARGNRRSDIFKDENDYKIYLNCLNEAMEYYKNKYKIIAYALMTNHIHIIIETSDKDVSDLIKRAHGIYALKFNKKYSYIGHLFQDRYKGIVIKNDSHLMVVSRYVHLNPVKANIVEKPEQYKWSSFSTYIGKANQKIVSTETILNYFKSNERYKRFVEISLPDEEADVMDVFDSLIFEMRAR